jgi:hypothetical protein
MSMNEKLSLPEALAAKTRFKEMAHLNAIEGNPLDAEDMAMFEMFERERWSHERCIAYIIDKARKAEMPHAAE